MESHETQGQFLYPWHHPDFQPAGGFFHQHSSNAVPTQSVKAIIISKNAGNHVGPASQAAINAGVSGATWDTPIPSAVGEQMFIAQIEFKETSVVTAAKAKPANNDWFLLLRGFEILADSGSPSTGNGSFQMGQSFSTAGAANGNFSLTNGTTIKHTVP